MQFVSGVPRYNDSNAYISYSYHNEAVAMSEHANTLPAGDTTSHEGLRSVVKQREIFRKEQYRCHDFISRDPER